MTDPQTESFLEHREKLFGIAYSILGSAADSDDVLQEAWLSWARSDRDDVENPQAYLVRVTANAALRHRSAANRRREAYVGPWLPEPLPTDGAPADGADAVLRAESTSMALLVVLETLSPAERVVFVLHEVFGYTHVEIADILGRSHVAVRQLAHRAREHVQARRPRYRTDARLQREATERFMAAALDGDVEALLSVLAPDVTLWTDGGGKGPATSPHPVRGHHEVARLVAALGARTSTDLVVRYRHINGGHSVLVLDGTSPFAVLVLDVAPGDGLVHGVYSVTNPDKLGRVR